MSSYSGYCNKSFTLSIQKQPVLIHISEIGFDVEKQMEISKLKCCRLSVFLNLSVTSNQLSKNIHERKKALIKLRVESERNGNGYMHDTHLFSIH